MGFMTSNSIQNCKISYFFTRRKYKGVTIELCIEFNNAYILQQAMSQKDKCYELEAQNSWKIVALGSACSI